jgi:hypothetical protein
VAYPGGDHRDGQSLLTLSNTIFFATRSRASSILTGGSTQSSSGCAGFKCPWEPPTGEKALVPFWQHSGVFSEEPNE